MEKKVANGLPEVVFVVHPTNDRAVIRIERGQSGYWPLAEYASNAEAKQKADALNGADKPTAAQIEAMVCGSMFGWDVPGANPEEYKK